MYAIILLEYKGAVEQLWDSMQSNDQWMQNSFVRNNLTQVPFYFIVLYVFRICMGDKLVHPRGQISIEYTDNWNYNMMV